MPSSQPNGGASQNGLVYSGNVEDKDFDNNNYYICQQNLPHGMLIQIPELGRVEIPTRMQHLFSRIGENLLELFKKFLRWVAKL